MRKPEAGGASPPEVKSGAVVVAAGLSLRMKAFKPLLPLGGSTIIRTAVGTLSASGCRPIVLVCGHRADELQDHLADLEVDCRVNPEYATSDMFRSACIGFAALPESCRRAFFLPGDVPLFSSRSLQAMMAMMDQTGAGIVIPAWQGRKGHPVLLDSRVIPGLLAYRGSRGLKGAIAACRHTVAVLELDDPGLVMDADRPDEYGRLLRYREKTGEPRGELRLARAPFGKQAKGLGARPRAGHGRKSAAARRRG